MRYHCCDERRRQAVRSTGTRNGIEFLEVVDDPETPLADRQRRLRLHFVNAPDAGLRATTVDKLHIAGGVRVTGIRIVGPLVWDGDVLVVRLDRPGDFSIYRLRLGESDGTPLPGLDPLLSAVDFSFKIECPTDLDCATHVSCPSEPIDEPEIDYLARDYHSFRQLMLDRMAVTSPDWQERNPADLGVALVEVLAYAADHVSYQMDATGMEASLATARLRTSARRHTRLVDYRVHDGSNARTWVHVEIEKGAGPVSLPEQTQLLTRVPRVPRVVTAPGPEYTMALGAGPIVFETMEERTFHESLNRLELYTWGDRECCLSEGATSASLSGRHDELRKGDVLVLLEQRGPRSGSEVDADLGHRHAVRLTEPPVFTIDPLGSWFADPSAPLEPLDVTEVAWGPEDALPFPLCISAIDRHGIRHEDISCVLGNIVLADHGRTLIEELPEVPASDPRLSLPPSGTTCQPGRPRDRPARYAPVLRESGLTMAGTIGRPLPGGDPRRPARYDPSAAAASAFRWQDRHVLPEVLLTERDTQRRWEPRRDLLASDAFAADFVVEREADGLGRLRFGDGEYGMRPRPTSTLEACYRTGSGSAGNIGAEALWHVVTHVAGIAAIRNPLPAGGGTDPDPLERIRQDAPAAFRVQQRAVTPADYAEVARRHPDVHQAVCSERWTGTWYTMFLTLDREGGRPVDAGFATVIRDHLERFRMAGHDLEIDGPRFVALDVALRVCVLPDHYRSDVADEVLSVLGTGRSPGGRPRLFHPDRLTFGATVHLSALLAVVQEVEGVRYVEPLVFRRRGDVRSKAVEQGLLTFGRLEIPRLDNDPNFPERGTLRLELEGGR